MFKNFLENLTKYPEHLSSELEACQFYLGWPRSEAQRCQLEVGRWAFEVGGGFQNWVGGFAQLVFSTPAINYLPQS